MPTGQPDSSENHPETTVDRVIREAIEAGEFDDLPGKGRPISGRGTVDDEMWWVRSWIQRNRQRDDQDASRPE